MPREVRTCSRSSRISVPGAATPNVTVSTYTSGPTPKKPLANPIPEDFSLVPWDAVRIVAEVMTDALKDHDRGGWRKLPRQEHVSRAARHLALYFVNGSDEELRHAVCRALMALET
jgi:hypothetical protein